MYYRKGIIGIVRMMFSGSCDAGLQPKMLQIEAMVSCTHDGVDLRSKNRRHEYESTYGIDERNLAGRLGSSSARGEIRATTTGMTSTSKITSMDDSQTLKYPHHKH